MHGKKNLKIPKDQMCIGQERSATLRVHNISHIKGVLQCFWQYFFPDFLKSLLVTFQDQARGIRHNLKFYVFHQLSSVLMPTFVQVPTWMSSTELELDITEPTDCHG